MLQNDLKAMPVTTLRLLPGIPNMVSAFRKVGTT